GSSPPNIKKINQAKPRETKPHAAKPGLVPDLNSDLQNRRIESQRAKEATDQKVKVVLDKIMWGSCGICLVAILWVMIAKTSCRSTGPIEIEDRTSENLPEITSQKILPQKNLNQRLISPLEEQAKVKLKSENPPEKGGAVIAPKSNQDRLPEVQGFKPIDQTIGFFHFDAPVNDNDRLGGLAPIRLAGVKWENRGDGGLIKLSDQSHIVVDREDAFDTIRELTILCKFKVGQQGGEKMYLFSLKNLLVVAIDKGSIRLGGDGVLSNESYGSSLNDQHWHEVAVILGKTKSSIWIDGKPISTNLTIPDFKASDNESCIGSKAGENRYRFKGWIDNLGLYWVALSEDQLRSQFAK
ncbi:MAG: LamG-like jellyroll fold domain-containing protein, partial [Planctomycetota bacterium]|nr:LamG-like jellyroll fold domain-containing protein [Planctomycetota bacterium]